MNRPDALSHLIEQLMVLPGIGRKTAQRLAFFILKMGVTEAKMLGEAVLAVKEKLAFCEVCNNVAEGARCAICLSPDRDTRSILVVEEPSTLHSIEKTGEYKGLYHVLLGTRSPLSGYEASDRAISLLVSRLEKGDVCEVIIATNPNMDGEATALYLARLIRPLNIKVTRIACGVPAGGDLEYVDEVTLTKSLQWRHEIS